MLKVFGFLLFLLILAVWIWLCTIVFKRLETDGFKGKTVLNNEMTLLVSYAGFFAFIYLLSGLWSLKLFFLFVASGQLAFVLSWLFNVLGGGESEKIVIRSLWAGKEWDFNNPRLNKVNRVFLRVVFLAYPIVAGILYFRHPWSSEILKLLIVKYSLLFLILSSYPALVVAGASLLSSENLDEDTRQRFFINMLVGILPSTPFIALAIWAFGAAHSGLPMDFPALSYTFSFTALLLMLAFFGVTVVLPYLAGIQRGRRRMITLLEIQRNYAAKLADILESPAAASYQGKLAALNDAVADDRRVLTESDKFIAAVEAANKRDPATISPGDQSLIDSLKQTRDLDPRFKFLDNTAEFQSELKELIEDLQQRSAATIETAAALWSKKFEQRKADLATEIQAASTRKPRMITILSTLATMILSAVFSEVGKAAWHIISSK